MKEHKTGYNLLPYIWLMRSGRYAAPADVPVFPNLEGDNAVEMLEGSQPGLYLMVDSFQGYDKLKKIKRCACYAHIRRYFLDTVPKGSEKDFSSPAVQGVAYCDKHSDMSVGTKKKGFHGSSGRNCRLKEEKPVVEAFIKWLGVQKPSAASNKFNKALSYARNRQDILMNYLEDGRCRLSNNMSENSIRPVVVDCKNWLFSDTAMVQR